MTSSWKKLTVLVLTIVPLSGCRERVVQPTPLVSTGTSSLAAAAVDVPRVAMARPQHLRPWDTSDVEMINALRAQDGQAVIAFKEAASARALHTGYRAAVTAATVRAGIAFLETKGVVVGSLFEAIGAVSVRMDPSLAPALRRSPLVDYVEPRQPFHVMGARVGGARLLTPADTQIYSWGDSMIGAYDAWSKTKGAGALVEDIDDGYQNGRSDLPLLASSNCAGFYGGCHANAHHPHGTAVMGVLAALGTPIVGAAPGLNASDVYDYAAADTAGPSDTLWSDSIIAGLNWGVSKSVKVINMSFGGPLDMGIQNAVANAWQYHDIVLVAAMGDNDGWAENYPASYPHVIGVSGVIPNGSFAGTSAPPCTGWTSDYGSTVSLAAPFWAWTFTLDSIQRWCGTSFSSAYVSGAAALVRAQNPTWTNAQVADTLYATAQGLGSGGENDSLGHGVVSVGKAFGIQPFSVTINFGPWSVRPYAVCLWGAAPSGGIRPVSYSWTPPGTQDDSLVDDSFSYSDSLRVVATDSMGQRARFGRYITVSWGAHICPSIPIR